MTVYWKKDFCTKEIKQQTISHSDELKIINPLSPSIHIQILQTDLHTFP